MAAEASSAKNRKPDHFAFQVTTVGFGNQEQNFCYAIWSCLLQNCYCGFKKDYFNTSSLLANMTSFCTELTFCLLYLLLTEIRNSFDRNNGTLQGGRVGFQSEHWQSGDQIYSPWVRPSSKGLPIRSRSQLVPAEQITEVLALTSEIDFLIQLSQCPRWRLRADSANRAGLREQNRFEFCGEQQTVLLQPAATRWLQRGKAGSAI